MSCLSCPAQEEAQETASDKELTQSPRAWCLPVSLAPQARSQESGLESPALLGREHAGSPVADGRLLCPSRLLGLIVSLHGSVSGLHGAMGEQLCQAPGDHRLPGRRLDHLAL